MVEMYNNTRDIILESVERIETMLSSMTDDNSMETKGNIGMQLQHIKTAANNE